MVQLSFDALKWLGRPSKKKATGTCKMVDVCCKRRKLTITLRITLGGIHGPILPDAWAFKLRIHD